MIFVGIERSLVGNLCFLLIIGNKSLRFVNLKGIEVREVLFLKEGTAM